MACFSDSAKEHIEEAVLCFEAGAFRSCIVSVWSAILFDLIDKIRELELAGEKAAASLIKKFEDAESKGDISALLTFERKLLENVRDELALISHSEFQDLDRVREDRHRSAHPSYNRSGERYVPAAETARCHIVNAVTLLLMHPPVQGKAALESIIKVVSSSLFPSDVAKAVRALEQTGLKRPKKALLRNSVKIFIKKFLSSADSNYRNFHSAFRALKELHRPSVLEVLERDFCAVLNSCEDNNLDRIITMLASDDELAPYLEEAHWDRLRSFIERGSIGNIDWLEEACGITKLKRAAEGRAKSATLGEIKDSLFLNVPMPLLDRLIELLSKAKSFDDANDHCSAFAWYKHDLTESQKVKLQEIGTSNSQVGGAFEYIKLMEGLIPAISEEVLE